MADQSTDGGCACCVPIPTATAAGSASEITAVRARDDVAADGPDIVCTLGGGAEAMRERLAQWQAVLAPATGRAPVEGGLRLTYAHDAGVALELARLAAAEFACCSFFTFTLTVGPGGTVFTVTAPQAAAELVTAVFGTTDAAAARESV
ncbi:hypothetical protein [Planomonospora algeriensis]